MSVPSRKPAAEGDQPTTTDNDTPGHSRHTWKSAVAAVLLALGFAWILHTGALPIVPDQAAFGKLRWWVIPAYALIWCAVLVARSVRWYWLLAPVCEVPMARVLRVSLIGFLGLSVLPLRMGEFVRPTLIHRRGKLSWWAATGTVGAERVRDGLLISTLLFAGLVLAPPMEPLPDRIGHLPVPVAVVPVAAYGALLLFAGAWLKRRGW